jgi:hypothetical protein
LESSVSLLPNHGAFGNVDLVGVAYF